MNEATKHLVERALKEDIGEGDLTSQYFIPAGRQVRAAVVAREPGVVAGVELAAEVFRQMDAALEIQPMLPDGSVVGVGALVLLVEGSARAILTAERTALNFLQHLSGIATATARYVRAVEGTRAKILDTRKTMPGAREIDKAAVRAGGGMNHRMGLYDGVMVKDNHLVAEHDLTSLQSAIQKLKEDHPGVMVEMEADRLDQVSDFLELQGVDRILLDNMSLDELREAVTLRGERARPEFEASGGVTLDTVAGIAATGVDYISVGALTHSVMALDLGLDFSPIQEDEE